VFRPARECAHGYASMQAHRRRDGRLVYSGPRCTRRRQPRPRVMRGTGACEGERRATF
jgi:hypothetical protein